MHDHDTEINGFFPSKRGRWQAWREQALSEQYELEMRGSELAKYWRIERQGAALCFYNALGKFFDRGDHLDAVNGNAYEIAARVRVAQLKSWESVRVTGTEAFREKAIFAALRMGLQVEPICERDREMITRAQEVMHELDMTLTPARQQQRERERGHDRERTRSL